MRIFLSCSGKPCERLDKLLKAYGLKSLFINNIINQLVDESGEITEEKVLAVLMNKFTITFDNSGDSLESENTVSEIDKLSEIAKGFE